MARNGLEREFRPEDDRANGYDDELGSRSDVTIAAPGPFFFYTRHNVKTVVYTR